jgi:hypothetical protein
MEIPNAIVSIMITKEKQNSGVRYHMTARDFVVAHESERTYLSSPVWIIRDMPTDGRNRANIKEYIRELSLLFIQKIKEFETLDHKATKAEKKQLRVLLRLLLEAERILYDEET